MVWLSSGTGFISADVTLFDSRSVNEVRYFQKMAQANFVTLPAGRAAFRKCCPFRVLE
jgi:hypothetical protein